MVAVPGWNLTPEKAIERLREIYAEYEAARPRRCDCESASCHPEANCQQIGTVKTLYNTVCSECAAKLPAKYLLKFAEPEANRG
jgi:hypothetical protein